MYQAIPKLDFKFDTYQVIFGMQNYSEVHAQKVILSVGKTLVPNGSRLTWNHQETVEAGKAEGEHSSDEGLQMCH